MASRHGGRARLLDGGCRRRAPRPAVSPRARSRARAGTGHRSMVDDQSGPAHRALGRRRSGSLVNAVLWYMSRDRVSLLAAIAGLAILFALRPSRYLE